MEISEILKIAVPAAEDRGCKVLDAKGDDDNNFEIILSKESAPVDLADCEAVHRAILAAYDRDIEDYSLTVGSKGISGDEADALLGESAAH
ncbi:MAG: hypothetical protein II967_00215 [Deltaproteobacteria bacterium]|nr:hypothetical protein [Deltaproteobacteria bacterium]